MITNFFLFGEKSIDDISTYCSDPVKKRFYQKMIFKPQTGTGDNHVKKKNCKLVILQSLCRLVVEGKNTEIEV